mmetsp:Transcript_5064/g.8633  ORF Transcript_5064/g.8633 Transcript_5064/m.8633 type:complete len:200 (+) Transcript_5064:11-610(+)
MGLQSQLTKKSTSLFILNHENLVLLQKRVLLFSGIDQKDIKLFFVKIDEVSGERVDVCTTVLGHQHLNDKPILIFAHGYAASGALYYKMYKGLLEKFCIILIDHVGMGASTRAKNFDPDNLSPQQTIDYFVENIEKWRKKFSQTMGKELTGFTLMGHSFGAYICSNYTLKYHKHVKKLILLSPIGMKLTGAALKDGTMS